MNHEVGVVRQDAGVHLEAAGVRFDHAFGDGETKADARVARGEERIGGAGGHLRGEARAVVMHPEGQFRPPIRAHFRSDRDRDLGRFAGRLEAIEKDLLAGVPVF